MCATFARNFTQLLRTEIRTLLPIFVEINLKMTELRSFNQDNPPIVHAELAADRRTGLIPLLFGFDVE